MNASTTYPEFKKWLDEICATEQPISEIIAYNFGLFEGEDGHTVYLVGSEEYDEDDSDWACNEDFTPVQRYFALPDSSNDEWEVVQENVTQMLKQFMEEPVFEESFLAKATAITVGYDDGDLERVK